ncbi:helix-turn-helix domain-containing protein [Paenibacillus sp. MMS20-IR301]|uniref:winged helix-turn-helix transcriptional regulator n=1 Tax=Paenibacillus sp. MMS20-IR301 TaxID=2895946 RepID=UPI0028E55E8F|nr:helix-turn-helix domain-containing protein [Paenibacillus sp. MMS20-IR301]WNS42471.1 helix-turn-helix domain-containing protein [Paenibacillus sp. MMS20-IR301]
MNVQGRTGSPGDAEENRQQEEFRSFQRTVEIISGKWKGVLLYQLISGTKRFNEIRRLCPGITQRMLSMQLRELERDGLVRREVFPQVPQRVEYSLTAWGRGLEPALLSIKVWGEGYREGRAQSETALQLEDTAVRSSSGTANIPE